MRVHPRGRWSVRWLSLVFATLTFASTVHAQPADAERDQEARANFELGKTAYDQGRFADSLRYFEHAYELSKRPELIFNVAQAHDRLRNDDAALEAYRRYLAELPEAHNRRSVEARIAILEGQGQDGPPVADAEAKPKLMPEQAPGSSATEQADPMTTSTSAEADDDGGVLGQWWFWTAIAVGAAAAAGTLVLVSSDPEPEPYVKGDVGGVVFALETGR